MKTGIILFVAALLTYTNVSTAQSATAHPDVAKAMSKFEKYTGVWKGQGWLMTSVGKKLDLVQEDLIQLKVDNTLLTLEYELSTNGMILEKILSVLSFSMKDANYLINSYKLTEGSNSFIGNFEQDMFVFYQGSNMRTSFLLTETEQLYRNSEVKQGDDWIIVYEMTQSKVK